MMYDVAKTIAACEEDPSLIFELIKEDHIALVDKLLTKKLVSVNTCDEFGYDVLSRLLKHGAYDVVYRHMKNKEWDVNHQNQNGDTFAHILVTIDYKHVLDIIKRLKKNKEFIPNIKNNQGETILDKSINNNYIYTTVKILEDQRFNNIDIVSFKNLYDTYVKSNRYGKYTKLTNLEIILDSLEDKTFLPRMEKLMEAVQSNFDVIKKEIFSNKKTGYMDQVIQSLIKEKDFA